MKATLTIHSIRNNWTDAKPRKPLVQLLHSSEYGDIHSVCFHPDQAQEICDAILKAASAAKRNRDIKPVKIEIGDD